ncbi:MAG: Ig-like domain-containing protein [Cystobacter sp.]
MNTEVRRSRAGALVGLCVVAWVGCAPAEAPREQPPGDTGRSEAALSLATGDMSYTRYDGSATLMADGRVLVVGGQNDRWVVNSAELYDPATGAFTLTRPMNNWESRKEHAAVRLGDGQVLVVGGGPDDYSLHPHGLRYDPAADVWSTTSQPQAARRKPTATLLSNGRVLVTGGAGSGGYPLESCELFDPTTGTFTLTAPMSQPRQGHTATLLANGKVLVTGGTAYPVSELYDPATQTWTRTGDARALRSGHLALRLNDGRVLVAGGYNPMTSYGILSSAELYDPVTGTWSATASMNRERTNFPGVVLATGNVAVFGGLPNTSSSLSGIEQFDAVSLRWSEVGSMLKSRANHDAVLLNSGRVLLVGGRPLAQGTGNAELYSTESSCTPLTCAGQGMNCGTLFDGCGRSVACGTCSSTQSCLGTNVCTASTGAATYDTTRRAPRCTQAGPLCDSMKLLNGRAGLGPESNAPNTLSASCADGTSGRYHNDGSLDRLRILTLDGSPLAAGKRVRIEATVWATYSGVDALDLYLAPQADAPQWRHLVTLTPPGSGTYTLSTTTTLPPGGTLQALRGVFRSGGTAAPCVPGATNDHDDLLFPVAGIADLPPSVQWLAPAPDARLQGVARLQVNATDDQGISRVEFYANTTLVGTVLGAPFEYAWNTTALRSGPYELTARVHDTSGQVTTSAVTRVVLANDTQPPTVSMSRPDNEEEVDVTGNTYISASDDQGLVRLEFYVDDQLVQSQALAYETSTDWSFFWSTYGFAAGAHTAYARALDGAGNSTQTVPVSFIIDNAPPHRALITSPREGAFVNWDFVPVTVDVADNREIQAVLLLVNGNPLTSSSTPPYDLTWDTRYTALDPSGSYQLSIRVYDGVGNETTSAPITVHIAPDTVAPSAAILSPAAGATVLGTVSVQVSVQDNRRLGMQELFVDGQLAVNGPYAGEPLSWNTASYANGSHVLVLRAHDAAGNQTDSAPVQVTVSNASPGQATLATYDATRKAPGCLTPGRASCDSGTLLNGRGGLGPESHAPNTLFSSCQDDSSGLYRSDESLERLKVATVDGSPLAVGRTVRIETTVWTYSSSADALDLYTTADANSPAWTLLTTLVPPGTGAQTLSATYTLPAGALQAVRGVFRYGGSPSVCTTASYRDHDDLFFAVQ